MNHNETGCLAVITYDEDKTEKIFDEIKQQNKKIVYECFSKIHRGIFFEDGTTLIWLRPKENEVRGRKFTHIWVDKNVDKRFLNLIVFPALVTRDTKNITWI